MTTAPGSCSDLEDDTPPDIASSPDLVHAVVLLSRADDLADAKSRPSRDERRRMARRRRDEAQKAIPVIDAILARCGGRRIGEATVLGTVAIETTPAGIDMLRRAPNVKSVVRDQPVSAVR